MIELHRDDRILKFIKNFMVKLRLRRTGKRGQPYYRIVAADSKSPRDGRFIEIIGNYNPRTKPSTIKLNKKLAQKWLDQGAQPTENPYPH